MFGARKALIAPAGPSGSWLDWTGANDSATKSGGWSTGTVFEQLSALHLFDNFFVTGNLSTPNRLDLVVGELNLSTETIARKHGQTASASAGGALYACRLTPLMDAERHFVASYVQADDSGYNIHCGIWLYDAATSLLDETSADDEDVDTVGTCSSASHRLLGVDRIPGTEKLLYGFAGSSSTLRLRIVDCSAHTDITKGTCFTLSPTGTFSFQSVEVVCVSDSQAIIAASSSADQGGGVYLTYFYGVTFNAATDTITSVSTSTSVNFQASDVSVARVQNIGFRVSDQAAAFLCAKQLASAPSVVSRGVSIAPGGTTVTLSGSEYTVLTGSGLPANEFGASVVDPAKNEALVFCEGTDRDIYRARLKWHIDGTVKSGETQSEYADAENLRDTCFYSPVLVWPPNKQRALLLWSDQSDTGDLYYRVLHKD